MLGGMEAHTHTQNPVLCTSSNAVCLVSSNSFYRLNLPVQTVLPVRVIVECTQQIIQLSPMAAHYNSILIRLQYKLPRPTYS